MEVPAPRVPEKFNPAYRVWKLLMEAKGQEAHIPTLAAWSNTLGITGTELLDERFHTVEMMHLLSRQISLAKNQVHVLEQFSEDTYNFAFDRAQETLNVAALGMHWESLKNSITPDVLTTLKWCSQATPADPIQVQEAELSTIEQELARFKAKVEEQTTNAELKGFVLEHIAIIEKAFLEYRIVGVRAFQRASGELIAYFEDPHNLEVYERNKDEPEVQETVSMWKRVLQAGQVASMANTAINVVQKGIELFGQYGHHLHL